jgi:hypothetical protein
MVLRRKGEGRKGKEKGEEKNKREEEGEGRKGIKKIYKRERRKGGKGSVIVKSMDTSYSLPSFLSFPIHPYYGLTVHVPSSWREMS